MCLVNNINDKAKEIIEKMNVYDTYREKLERKAEQNHLYKIDREDKKTFKENNDIINKEKQELENMIREYLGNTKII
jgi:transcription termination factor NusB